jgi:hypothetical protein
LIVKHFILTYTLAPDYLERRPQFRSAHLALAKQQGVTEEVRSQVNMERLNVRSEQANVRDRDQAIRNQESEVVSRDKQLNNRDTQLTNRDSQISRLQSQQNAQQQSMSSLLAELQKAKEPPPFRVALMELPEVIPSPTLAPKITAFLVTTNRVVTPVRGIFACEGNLTGLSTLVVTAGMIVGLDTRIAPNAYQVQNNTPAWTPDSPLLIKAYYSDRLGNCNCRM